ncbi:MAG: DUF835 domain-containing protein [Thermoplasmata archaeon]|nr:DUF835 domain-containing protein [Thermoplasmata archaeon]
MRRLFSFWVLALSVALVMSLPGSAVSQEDHTVEPTLVVETRMQMTSIGDLDGSGSIKVTFSGEPARELRQYILSEFDASMNQIIDSQEAKNFLMSMAAEVDGRSYWGVTLSPTTDFNNMSLTDISERTVGLILHEWNSTDDLVFWMDFEGRGEGFSKVIFITETAAATICGAVRDSTGYSFDGVMRIDHRTVSFGFGSFTVPELNNGTIQELRTPAGAVLWYASEFEVRNASSVEAETISYEEFSAIENQQIAFIILLICSLMIARMPAHRFEKFRKLHPKRYRKYASPRRSVKVVAIALLAIVWVLYAFPFLTGFLVDGFVLYSIYFIFIGPIAVMAQYAVSRFVYDRSALDIPEDAVIEVKQAAVAPEEAEALGLCAVCYKPMDHLEEVHVCEVCETEMHIACGDRVQACPTCGTILFPQDTRSIQCKSCGETFLYTGNEDLYSIQCTRCGAFQEEVEASKNYLVIDSDPMMAYRMMKAMGISGRAAMIITSEFPGKIRADHELGEEVDVRWFSESTTDIDNVNPHDLEGDAMETASTFLMTTKRAGLMIDGLNTLIDINGFDKVLAYIRRLNDLATIHGSTILLHTDKSSMDDGQFKVLTNEFDEIHDYL